MFKIAAKRQNLPDEAVDDVMRGFVRPNPEVEDQVLHLCLVQTPVLVLHGYINNRIPSMAMALITSDCG